LMLFLLDCLSSMLTSYSYLITFSSFIGTVLFVFRGHPRFCFP
jgi:hypothetical protein